MYLYGECTYVQKISSAQKIVIHEMGLNPGTMSRDQDEKRDPMSRKPSATNRL